MFKANVLLAYLLVLVVGLSSFAFILADVAVLTCKLKAALHLEEGELRTVTISKEAFDAGGGGGEMMINGKLCDIKSYRINGNTVTLQIWEDDNEMEALEAQVRAVDSEVSVCQSNDSGGIKFSKVKKYFHFDKIFTTIVAQKGGKMVGSSTLYKPINKQYRELVLCTVISPPPDFS
ncbi:MAG: hypothetical protein EBX41_09495 [Chitinophagia bacterium]|nr:hypothetical protein [Chitinophagia bacterium]